MSEEIDQALEILRLVVAPALAASFLVMLTVRLLGGEKLAPLAAALAVAAGLFAGNHFRGLMSELASHKHPTVQSLRSILAQALEKEATEIPEGQPQLFVPQRQYWLPWLAGLAMLVELLVGLPRVPAAVGWVMRAFVAFFAARLMTPESMRLDIPESPWLLGGAMLLLWSVVTSLVRKWQDGVVGTVLLLCLLAATLALKQQASGPSLAEMMVLCFAASMGPALVAWKLPGDTSPAAAVSALVLPSLLLLGQQSTVPPLPIRNFMLIAFAPLAMAPMLFDKMARATGISRWLPGMLLPLIPLALAIYWVLQENPLTK